MTAALSIAGDRQPLGRRQVQVLGWVVNRDVTRDCTFVYRVRRRAGDVDDEVYDLEDRGLVDLLPDGRVVATPTGEQVWQQHRGQRRQPVSTTPQFTPADEHTRP